ncbi:PF13663 domain protein [Bordetella pertussis H897]|nr:PF13663 domain protein [Bordetella pertussis H897]
MFGEAQEPAARPAGDAATRAQVQAELAQARDASAASEYVETGA